MNKPNILIFMTDQQRACSVLPGDPYKAITPVLDEFRKDAVTFSRTYCPSPHCCPSRASFMTGLMPTQHRVWHNVGVANAITRGLPEDTRPWSVDMHEAGYRMYYTGKWHVSNYQRPADYGWEGPGAGEASLQKPTIEEQDAETLRRETRNLEWVKPVDPDATRRAGEIVRPGHRPYVHYGVGKDTLGDDKVINAALDVLDGLDGEDPWCVYVGPIGPHDPYFPPQRFLDMYDGVEFELPDTFEDKMLDKPALYRRTRDRFDQLSDDEHREAIKHYLAYCSYEDWLFGKIIEKLKERGDYDDAVILYCSDHGDYVADHGLWAKGLPSFLVNYHVPAIMKAPGCDSGTVRAEFVSLCDFGPTFLELAELTSPVDMAGDSLVPLLQADSCSLAPDSWRDALFFQTNGNETYGIQRSIVTDKWRFVYNGYDYDELYDLEADPGQIKNLNGDPEHESVKEEMYRRIWEYGLAHGEQHVNGYIMTAMSDYGPGIAFQDPGDRGHESED